MASCFSHLNLALTWQERPSSTLVSLKFSKILLKFRAVKLEEVALAVHSLERAQGNEPNERKRHCGDFWNGQEGCNDNQRRKSSRTRQLGPASLILPCNGKIVDFCSHAVP